MLVRLTVAGLVLLSVIDRAAAPPAGPLIAPLAVWVIAVELLAAVVRFTVLP